MCGITGYVGRKPAVATAVENLKRLEYRGYDSAGVAYATPGGVRIVKSPGKIVELESLLGDSHGAARAAVAHTRWATHGGPTEANAHPHRDCSGTLAVVHNGIVENYAALRAALRADGHEFGSETDTEVIAHLIEREIAGLRPGVEAFAQAVLRALGHVRGSFAIAVVWTQTPEAVVVARRDSPLIIGLGRNETFIASDIPAVMQHTRRVLVLENGDGAIVTARGARLFSLHDGRPIERPVLQVTWDAQAAEKEGFAHFMLKEIHDGPKTVRDTLRGRTTADGRVEVPDVQLTGKQWARVRRVHIVACGTAYHAGLVGKRLMEELLRRPVEATVASEFRYSDPLVDEETLTVLVSQSGETADTLAALRQARALRSPTLAIVNVVGSTLAREADAVLYTQAGPEISVASTKAYLAQLVALALLSVHLAQMSGAQDERCRALVRALKALPEQLTECLSRGPDVAALAEQLAQHSCFFYLGRGYDHAVSLEAALKLKEISYIHAEAYPAGEMKHGPLALVEPGVTVVGLSTQPATREKMASNLRETKSRGATVVVVQRDDDPCADGADHVIGVPPTVDALMPVLSIVPMQLLAYHVARARGCPIDQPRNLAKSVTVE
ncbi:MAG TPA: glutamine--fructose-6-phosphate transaminase (isomerizing) [Chthonomonadales bacterium]|nr:glutamine--fructose-6-phosphate transaminase (isomerizing) [Chthonomonadales bacterium]